MSHEIKQVLERINQGLSPSVNAVRQENTEIKLSLQKLEHTFEMDMKDMKGMVRESTELVRSMLDNFHTSKVEPVATRLGFIEKTFVYGLVGAVIVFLGQKGINEIYDRVFLKRIAITTPQ